MGTCGCAPTMSSPRWSKGWAGMSPGAMRRSTRRSGPMPASRTAMITSAKPAGNPGLYRLLAWLSPSFPIGAFSYSHGLEAAVTASVVNDRISLEAWIAAVVAYGSGRIDADILCDAYRAGQARDGAGFTA